MIDELRKEASRRVSEGDFIGHLLPIANQNKVKRAMSLKCSENLAGWNFFVDYVRNKINLTKYKRIESRSVEPLFRSDTMLDMIDYVKSFKIITIDSRKTAIEKLLEIKY